MPSNLMKAVVPLCLSFAALTAGSAPSWALSDLIINVEDSRIQPGSCDESSPLVTGRIAIKNQGEDAAALKVTERFTRSLLAVYVPENIDMIDKKSQNRKLDPFDQEGIAFEIGSGIVKKGRQFGPPSATSIHDDQASSRKKRGDRQRVTAIQRALDKIGFDPGTIDGVIGPNSRTAIRDFQESIGAVRTATLTDSQVRILFDKAGNGTSTSSGSTYGAHGEVEVTIYAVVDPYNLVQESNEANNLKVFKFTVDCGE